MSKSGKVIIASLISGVIIALATVYLLNEEQKANSFAVLGFYVFVPFLVTLAGLIVFSISRKKTKWQQSVIYLTLTFLNLAFLHGLIFIATEYLLLLLFTLLPAAVGIIMLYSFLQTVKNNTE